MVILSRTTNHSKCPEQKKNWRVKDYQSTMAIRPTNHPDKPGVEFSLTAFEDPGVALPESVISFVAVRTMPEFMTNLRAACVKLRGSVSSIGLPKPEIFKKNASLRNINTFDESKKKEEFIDDASYESAWIDKLLKDSDESESETEQSLEICNTESLDRETDSIRDGDEHAAAYHDYSKTKNFNSSFNNPKYVHSATEGEHFVTKEENDIQNYNLSKRNSLNFSEDNILFMTEENLETDLLKDEKTLLTSIDINCPNSLIAPKEMLSSSSFIENEMELVQYEEKDISQQTAFLKHQFEQVEGNSSEYTKLLNLWLELVSRKNLVFHRRLKLDILQNLNFLETRCRVLQNAIRDCTVDDPKEKILLDELVHIIDLRDQLTKAEDEEEASIIQELKLKEDIQKKMVPNIPSREKNCRIQ